MENPSTNRPLVHPVVGAPVSAAKHPVAVPPAKTTAAAETAGRPAAVDDADLLRAVRLTVFDRLASYLTHELNQPVSIARMTAENVLLDLDEADVPKDVLRERLGTICSQTERMTALIERLGQLGNQRDEKPAPFDICRTLQETAATLRHAAVMSGLSFEVSPPDGQTLVSGSPRELWLVLVGLLTMTWEPGRARQTGRTNAKGSGILIHAERRKLTVAIDLIHDGCEATGQPGVTVSDLASDVRLRAARRVVEQMDGRFDARLRDNGLHVRLVLPLADAAIEQPAAEGKAAPEGKAAKDTKHIRAAKRPLEILLVDDEELALEGILEHLSRQGHRVVTARNGREALLRFGSRAIDVVMTDLRMPVMDGNELIRQLRRQSPLPIIVMTGHAGPEDEEQALSDGASTILHKPIRLRDLSNALDKVAASL